MPTALKRYYGAKHLHFLTCTCYHRIAYLARPQQRDLVCRVLEQLRRRYRFVIVGYVIMPEHFHLLVSEPEIGDPSLFIKVLKQESAYQLNRIFGHIDGGHIWQKRFYDFNIWSERKRMEKLRYIHRNPVRRGLVSRPEDWAWSSFRSYAYGEAGLVRVNCQEWQLAIKAAPRQSFDTTHAVAVSPLIRKTGE